MNIAPHYFIIKVHGLVFYANHWNNTINSGEDKIKNIIQRGTYPTLASLIHEHCTTLFHHQSAWPCTYANHWNTAINSGEDKIKNIIQRGCASFIYSHKPDPFSINISFIADTKKKIKSNFQTSHNRCYTVTSCIHCLLSN